MYLAMKKNKIEYPKVVQLEAVLMEDGEVIHYGKSLGFICKRQRELIEAGANKISRPNVDMIAISHGGNDIVA